MAKINERIKERRTQLGLTLLQIANRLGVKEATVQRYESGEIKNIKHETIIKLAEILECSPTYLMGWDTDKTSKQSYVTKGQAKVDPSIFCENLYNLMKENNVDTGMLSLDMGFDQKDIASWLSGKTVPSSDIVLSLANYFGVDTTALTNTMQRTRCSFSDQRMSESPGPAIVMGHGGPGGQRRVGAPRKQLLQLYDILNDMTDQQLKVVADLAKNLKDMDKKGK